MATDAAVVIAYRPMGTYLWADGETRTGCPHRGRAFDYVTRWYTELDWPIIVEGGEDDASFGRASAINTAIGRTNAKVIVQTDPDSLVPLNRLRDAVDLAGGSDGLVIPHSQYQYASEDPTRWILADLVDPFGLREAAFDEHGLGGSGNVVVFSRATWEQAGGFDERFGVWGGDDAAFRYACDAIVAPTRQLPGKMVHLWHPRLPQSRPGHPGYAEQFSILAQYRDAAAQGPAAVRALVEARRV